MFALLPDASREPSMHLPLDYTKERSELPRDFRYLLNSVDYAISP